ncbi:MAG: hypothetical protein NC434_03190 [Ruminococcus sp.]|nr:hypothetical protein [Ruminococcus sp.]
MMNFTVLDDLHKTWRDILVIGKTIKHDNGNCHMIGMTLSDAGEATLYILEPYITPEDWDKLKRKNRSQRQRLKENVDIDCCYLHCSDFYLGEERLQVQGGQGGCLEFSTQDYGIIQIFSDMMSAGWVIPEWLKEKDWNDLQLISLRIADLKKLPVWSPEMPITIKHRPNPVRHILEKTVTLHVGKSRSFSFIDHTGDKVFCYVNQVTLIDVWEDTKKQLNEAKLSERFSPEQLQQVREHHLKVLEQSCPQGMCYIGIEYECTKDIQLGFYSKQYLSSQPEVHNGSSMFFLMRLKPEQETGMHGLALKGCVIQTPVPLDTTVILAELFHYYENTKEWVETV